MYNAFRAQTVDELIACFKTAWADSAVGVVILTGAGDKAFCTGGDQKQRAQTGDYGPSATGLFEIEALHRVIRDIPKPVIAAVNGFAIGGGHVLHVVCDLTIASEHGALRTDRPPRRLVRRRLRIRLPRARRRREAREGDLVPVPAVHGRAGPAVGPRQRRRSRPSALMDEARAWATEILDEVADRDPLPQALVQRRFGVDRRHRHVGVGRARSVRRAPTKPPKVCARSVRNATPTSVRIA